MEKYKIFIIEDKPDKVQSIRDSNFNNESYEVEVLAPEQDFDAGLERLDHEMFDILILDLKKDPGEEHPGSDIFNKIWNGVNSFLPVVVFSAYHADLEISEHPLIAKFDKTEEQKVILHLRDEILPKICRIRELKKEINQLAREGLRAVRLNEDISIQEHRMANYIKHHLENICKPDQFLPPDIQYILLPIFSGLYSGDILQKIPDAQKGIGDDEFCMIMTPSCEMHSRNSRGELRYKKDILCKKIIEKPTHVKMDSENNIFNNGHDGNGYIFLPKLTLMNSNRAIVKNKKVVESKSSIIVEQEKISLNSSEMNVDDFEWRKVASIASPYRERMVAACYSHRSRIGVPNLNKDVWWE